MSTRTLTLIGIVALAMICAFPPWDRIASNGRTAVKIGPPIHRWILSPPGRPDTVPETRGVIWNGRLAAGVLATELLACALFTTALTLASGSLRKIPNSFQRGQRGVAAFLGTPRAAQGLLLMGILAALLGALLIATVWLLVAPARDIWMDRQAILSMLRQRQDKLYLLAGVVFLAYELGKSRGRRL